MKVLLNGHLVNSDEAVISVYDHGFLYGMGLFETFRTYGGKPWLLERHARRLGEGCRLLGIGYRPEPDRMAAAVARLLEANGLRDAYVRWSVSAGTGPVGLPSDDYPEPSEIVYMKPLAPDDPASRPGKTLRLLRLPRSGPEGGVRLKSFHYMNNIAAKRELSASGAAPGTEGVFLNESGYISEGIVSNVFWVRDGVLYTPALQAGPLAGVTRDYVMELAAQLGLEVREGLYRFEHLAAAEEAFVTNSIQEIVPIDKLEDAEGRPASSGAWKARGPWTARLMSAYRQAIGKAGDENHETDHIC